MRIKTANLAKMSCRSLLLRSSSDTATKLAAVKVAVKAVVRAAVKEALAAPEQADAEQVVVPAAVPNDLVDPIRNHRSTFLIANEAVRLIDHSPPPSIANNGDGKRVHHSPPTPRARSRKSSSTPDHSILAVNLLNQLDKPTGGKTKFREQKRNG